MTETIPAFAPYIEAMKNGDPLPDFLRKGEGFGTPEDCAALVPFLASEAARGITGQAIDVARLNRQRLLEQAAALDSFDEKRAAALFARFVKNGTRMCPTLSVLRAVAFSGDADFRSDPRIKYIPDFLKQFWEDAYGWKEHTPEFNAQAKRVFQKQLEVVGMMNRAGVQIIGTNAASNASLVTCNIDVSNATPGTWDVVVDDGGTKSASLPGALTITA